MSTPLTKHQRNLRDQYDAAVRLTVRATEDKRYPEGQIKLDQAYKFEDAKRIAYERSLGKCSECERNVRHVNRAGELLDVCMACTWTGAMLGSVVLND